MIDVKQSNNKESFTIVTKWYNGTMDAIQVNNDKTYQEVLSGNLNNVTVRDITKRELRDYTEQLEKSGYTKLDPIK